MLGMVELIWLIEWVFGCLGFVVELSIGDGDAQRRGLLWWLIGMGRFEMVELISDLQV